MKALLLSFLIFAAAALGCGAGLSAAQLWDYNEAQQECVADASTQAEADSCRASVRAAFCAAHPGLDSRCDGGAE